MPWFGVHLKAGTSPPQQIATEKQFLTCACSVPLTIFDLISPAAFSSLWYWVVTALVWSRLAQAPFGVPSDLYERARQGQNGDEEAFVLIKLGVQRHLTVVERLGPVLIGGWAFVLSSLAGLAMLYQLELAQAILILLAPVALAQFVITRGARRMTLMEPETEALLAVLRRIRMTVQAIALFAIFCAALFGMIHNLRNAVF